MSIKIGSKYIKDGVISKVTIKSMDCVWFGENNKLHVLTEADFLEQYKPYDPIYEYQYAYIRINISASLTSHPFYYTNDEIEKFHEQCGCKDIVSYQRLDFTKRERTLS